MCWREASHNLKRDFIVSVAGCLGYDVLEEMSTNVNIVHDVSVAGCLGYDVLAHQREVKDLKAAFQLLVV